MHIIVSVYISRIYLALEKSVTGFFKTTKILSFKVSMCWGVMEYLLQTNFSQLAVSFFLGGSNIIKLLFNTILKYIEHALENTKLFYYRKLTHIFLHFTD